MNSLRRLTVVFAAVVLGVVFAYFATWKFAEVAFACPPTVRTCDAGAYLGLMLLFISVPICGLLAGVVASRLYRKYGSRPD